MLLFVCGDNWRALNINICSEYEVIESFLPLLLLTEVALHPRTLVLLKLGYSVAEERNDQLLQGNRCSVRDRQTETDRQRQTDTGKAECEPGLG